jgi:predicted ATP-dependent protease
MNEKTSDLAVGNHPTNGAPARAESPVKAADAVTQQVLYGTPGSETAGLMEQAENLFTKDSAAAAGRNPEKLSEDTLKDIETQIKKWKKQAVTLRSVHATLTIAATFCSFLVAAFSSKEDFRTALPFFSFGAAVSIGLLSAFDLGSKANRLRRAWRLIRVQIFRYKQDKVTAETLIATYAMAEELIGDVREEPN